MSKRLGSQAHEREETGSLGVIPSDARGDARYANGANRSAKCAE